MKEDEKDNGEKSPKKKYDFGEIKKIQLKTSSMEISVFGSADAMPGGDGNDPCWPQYNMNTNYKIKEDIFHTVDADQNLLIVSALETENCYYSTTGVSKDVYLGMTKNIPLSQISREIIQNYDVEESTVQKDISTFIAFLLENKIIEEK